MTQVLSAWRPIGTGFLAWMNAQASVTGLSPALVAPLDWDRRMQAHPRYPDDPVSECPCGLLRAYKDDEGLLEAKGTKFEFRMSLWVYLRQTPGQSHQVVMLDYLQKLASPIQTNPRPADVMAAGCELMRIEQIVVRDEQRHEFDEPRLRVSAGEILYVVTARKYS